MRFILVRPTKRQDSANPQFVQRIPIDLRPRLAGVVLEIPLGDDFVRVSIGDKTQAIRFSLRTSDPHEAKVRQAQAIAHLEKVFASLRAQSPLSLSHKQCIALSGDLYRSYNSDLETSSRLSYETNEDGTSGPVDDIDYEVEAIALRLEADRLDVLDSDDLEASIGPLVDKLLLRKGVSKVDPQSRTHLLAAFRSALSQGMRVRANKAMGDYRPDPDADRFPDWSSPNDKPISEKPIVLSLRGLFNSWWSEAERAGKSISTKESFGSAMDSLIKFIGHDDATLITDKDAICFKDHLVSTINPRTKKRLSMKTISGSYIGGLKVIFRWAVENKKLQSNPFADVRVIKGKQTKKRESWFNLAERKAILTNAINATKRIREPEQRFHGRKWVPLLCAYTGARVGEMVQLRKKDIYQVEGHWVVCITPEAGTVKTGETREVPIHPHLLDVGFLEFIKADLRPIFPPVFGRVLVFNLALCGQFFHSHFHCEFSGCDVAQ